MSTPISQLRQSNLFNPLRFDVVDAEGTVVGAAAIPVQPRGRLELQVHGDVLSLRYGRLPGKYAACTRYTLATPQGVELAQLDVEPTLAQLGARMTLRLTGSGRQLNIGPRRLIGPLCCWVRDEQGKNLGILQQRRQWGLKRVLRVELPGIDDTTRAFVGLVALIVRV